MEKRDYSNLPEHLPHGKLAFNDSTNELFIGAGENAPLQKVTNKEIEDELRVASIDYSGEHHTNLKDSMDANVDFVMGEFNSVQMTGEYITAQNTIPRHVKRAELKGHTEVNVIQEPSGEDVVLPYSFEEGEYVTINDTKESGALNIKLKGQTYQNILPEPTLRNEMQGKSMQRLNEGYDSIETVDGVSKSAILKGQTLVNLWKQIYGGVNVQEKVDGTTIEPYSEQYNRVLFGEEQTNPSTTVEFKTMYKLEANKTYYINTFVFDFADIDRPLIRDSINWVNLKTVLISGYPSGSILSFETTKETDHITFYYFAHSRKHGSTNYGKPFYMPIRFIVSDKLEDVTNKEFFTGMASCKMPVLTTTGKNLFDISYYGDVNNLKNTTDAYVSYKKLLKLEPNTRYIILSDNCVVPPRMWSVLGIEDKNSNRLTTVYNHNRWELETENDYGAKNSVFTTASDGLVKFVCYARYRNPDTLSQSFDNAAMFTSIMNNIRLVKDGEDTTYEPHKTNILHTSEEVVLKGIGDVQDTLNCNTGEYVERIKEIVFDGSDDEDWYFSENETDSNGIPFFENQISNLKGGSMPICDNMVVRRDRDGEKIANSTTLYGLMVNNSASPGVRIKNGATNLTDFKAILQTNPVTVQIVLATPTVKTVDLSILDQNGDTQENLHSFANGHLQVSSEAENSLLPSVQYEIPTKNSYHMDLMKTNTLYTMKAKSVSGTFTIDDTSYNVNANGTFTSPSSMTDKLLIMSNKTNEEVMLLEGNVIDKTIPYFKGIKSAFEGEEEIEIVSIGKNLCSVREYIRENLPINAYGSTSRTIIDWNIPVKPKTTYRITYKREGVNSNLLYAPAVFVDSERKEFNENLAHSDVYGKTHNKTGFELIGKQGAESGQTFTTRASDKYLHLTTANSMRDIPDYETFTYHLKDIMIEEVANDSETNYEPHKSNITKIPLLSPLRSLPNGVCDELIIDRLNHKAKLIQRVGIDDEVVSQLATPIITEIDLTSFSRTYDTTTHIYCKLKDSSISPVISSDNTISYPAILKPNTKYSVITNPTLNGHTSTPISCNLGGASIEILPDSGNCHLITTPSNLAHSNLTFTDGNGHKLCGGVMLLEGDKTGMMFNYFEGMKSVENPIVKVTNGLDELTESYKSNTLTIPTKLSLRSLPNGVCDTLDLITGEYVQNIYEYTFTGEEQFTTDGGNEKGYIYVRHNIFPNTIMKRYSYILCNQFPYSTSYNQNKHLGVSSTTVLIFTLPTTFGFTTLAQRIEYIVNLAKTTNLTVQFELKEPITTKLDLRWEDGKLFAYDGTTHFLVDIEGGHLYPVFDVDVPVNLSAEFSRLRAEKEQLQRDKDRLENQLSLVTYHKDTLYSNVQSLQTENSQLKTQAEDLQVKSNVLELKSGELEECTTRLTQSTAHLSEGLQFVDSTREKGDLELLSSDFDLDFRLMEIEFALDLTLPAQFRTKEVRNMARTPYEMAKTLILGGKYDREDMEFKLGRYLKRGQITQEQHDELLALMEANDLM